MATVIEHTDQTAELVAAAHAVATPSRAAWDAGARSFSVADRTFMSKLLEIEPAAWGAAAERSVWEVLTRYEPALTAAGIDLERLPVPAVVPGEEKHVRSIFLRDRDVVLVATYHEGITALARAVEEGHYNRQRQEWTFPATVATARGLAAIVRAHPDFGIGPSARVLLRELMSGQATAAPPRALSLTDDGFLLTLPRPSTPQDWELLALVRLIDTGQEVPPRDSGQQGGWLFDARSERAALSLARLLYADHGIVADHAALQALPEDDGSTEDVKQLAAEPGSRQIAYSHRCFRLTFPYDPKLVEEIKALDGATFKKDSKTWSASRTIENGRALADIAVRHALEINAKAATQIAQLAAKAELLAADHAKVMERAEQQIAGMRANPGPLMAFQQDSVADILRRRRVLLADLPGLGKTLQALTAALTAQEFPVVVICPAGLKLNWRAEQRKWFPHLRLSVVATKTASGEAVANADVVVCNYDIASHWADTLIKLGPRALICDESHYLKEKNAGRTNAVIRIAEAVPDSGIIILASGTPVVSRPNELVPQLRILRHLRAFGGVKPFQERYCKLHHDGHRWTATGSSNELELHERLIDLCMIRRRKEDVLHDFPEKRDPAEVIVEITNRRSYESTTKNVIAELLADKAGKAAYAKAMESGEGRGDAVQAAKAAAAAAQAAAALVLIGKLRRLASIGKVKAANAWITDFLSTGEKLVVFSDVTETQAAIVKAFPDCAHILAEDSKPARHAAVERFQNDPACRLIVCGYKTAGAGLTMTAASDLLFIDLPWTPADLEQAEDRCHRIGQTNAVTPWMLLADDTIDADVLALLAAKRQVVDAVVDGIQSDSPTHGTSVALGVAGRLLAAA